MNKSGEERGVVFCSVGSYSENNLMFNFQGYWKKETKVNGW